MRLGTDQRDYTQTDRKIETIQVTIVDQIMPEIIVERQTMTIVTGKGETIETTNRVKNVTDTTKAEIETEMIDTDMIIVIDTTLGIPDR